MRITNLISCLCLFLLFSCGKKEIKEPLEYTKWLADPENNLVQTRYINGIKISVKYLPPEYLAYIECKDKENVNKLVKDSLVRYYEESKTFVLNIGPDERKGQPSGDIMMSNISHYQDYKGRNFTMNFEMQDYISLEIPGASYAPVLCNLENVYGLDKSRNIFVVFADKEKKGKLNVSKELDFVFDDEIFGTGRSHFVFNKKDLNDIPHFIF